IEPYHQSDRDEYPAWLLLGQDAFSTLSDVARSVPQSAANAVAHCLEANPGETEYFAIPERARELMERDCAALFRDILGDHFRPVTFSPSWLPDTAIPLARTMYESRAFNAMPILADALQDAGCDNNEVLNHCRARYAKHVRGCWVVDLVLSKE